MEARRVDGARTPRSGHHEEDGLDRGFIREPPFLRLEVVAGAGLLVFGHGCLARRRLAGLVCGWLSAEADCFGALAAFRPRQRAEGLGLSMAHCGTQCWGRKGSNVRVLSVSF